MRRPLPGGGAAEFGWLRIAAAFKTQLLNGRRNTELGRRSVGQQRRSVDRIVPGVNTGTRQRRRVRPGLEPVAHLLALTTLGLMGLAMRKHHRTERCGDQQCTGDLEREDVPGEEELRDLEDV